jgi:hypothetical protein
MADYTYNEAGVTYNQTDIGGDPVLYNGSVLTVIIDWIRRKRRRRN